MKSVWTTIAVTALVIMLLALTAACSANRSRVVIREQPASEEAVRYLALLDRFQAAEPAERAQLYRQAEEEYQARATAANSLWLGLVTAWPGHAGTNPDRAGQLIIKALDSPESLPVATVHLARVYMAILEQQQRTHRQTVKLQQELSDAREKIKALTDVESIVDPPADKPENESHSASNPDDGG